MLKIQIKVITHWNGKETDAPRRSTFRQIYRDTLKILEKELSFLDVRDGKLSSRDEALQFIAEHSAYALATITGNPEALKAAYRQAAHKFHPDKTGGESTQEILILQQYKKVLGL
jgi:hypothetical protein